MHKAGKAARSAKMEYQEADNGYCCTSNASWYQRNKNQKETRQHFPKGMDHKRHQRRLKAQAKRLHSKAQRRLAKIQCQTLNKEDPKWN